MEKSSGLGIYTLMKKIKSARANDMDTKKSITKPGSGIIKTANMAMTVNMTVKSLSLIPLIAQLLLQKKSV